AFALAAACLAAPAGLSAQPPVISRGYQIKVPSEAAGLELSNQSDLWVLEVQMKPVRMLWTDITDPVTKKKSRELVWYLVYKAINRPLDRQQDTSDTDPVNEEDPPPGPPMFIPEFTLVTTDGGVQQAYADQIIPEAQAVISSRERQALGNAVEVIGPVPAETPHETEPQAGEVIHGIVTWRGIDPETDYFTVYLTGFSNGFRIINGPDGQPLVLRKTVVQDFWRPGDEFEQTEREVRVESAARWEYRPDDPGAIASVPPGAVRPEGEQAVPADADGAAAAPAQP
ncbi:MAG TPA: hypothetical protein VML55_18640, partial [Planctomycetaceae bacterium]|nr:hypothetical protein [Planctomycetaceae bacterium]